MHVQSGTPAIDLFGALSLMADMALGLTAGHGARATYIAMRIAGELGLPEDERADLFYAGLLTDAGCTAWASQAAAAILGNDIDARRQLFFFTDPADPRDMLKWLTQYLAAGERAGVRIRHAIKFAMHGREFMYEGLQNTSEAAARFARRLDRSARVQDALRCAFERWNGSGPEGRRGDAIPLISRITYAAIFLEVFHAADGRSAAVALAETRRGKDIDPAVAARFLQLAKDEAFWRALESDSIWTLVRQMEPESPFRYFDVAKLDDAAHAFGDFADLKSFYSAGHSRRVAALAESVALAMGLGGDSITTVRRAALLHDIGLAAVPSFVLHKREDRLSEAETEMMRLHPYHAERILSRAPVFTPLCRIVAAHHERPDGTGYFRGLPESAIPNGARIVSVADRFDELTHAAPERDARSAEEALELMNRERGAAFSENALAALRQAIETGTSDAPAGDAWSDGVGARPSVQSRWPAGLTDREIDVMRALATGASRSAIAAKLCVSEHTIRHHLEHIYAKIDARTRVEATLFAIEHGLLA